MRWPVDRDAAIHEALAELIDIVHGVGEMAKISALIVVFGIPVMSEFDLCIVIAGSCQKNQRETALIALIAVQFLQAEFVAIKIQRFVQVADTYHCVQIFHEFSLFMIRLVEVRHIIRPQ